MFWDPKGQEIGKCIRDKAKNKHSHLICPSVCMKSSCSDKLCFQRHACEIRDPKKTCARTSLAQLKSRWIPSGTACASL